MSNITRTDTALIINEDCTLSEWSNYYPELKNSRGQLETSWQLADWVAFGLDRYNILPPHFPMQIVSALRILRTYKPDQRTSASLAAHMMVAYIDEPQRRQLLDRFVSGELTTLKALREAAHELRKSAAMSREAASTRLTVEVRADSLKAPCDFDLGENYRTEHLYFIDIWDNEAILFTSADRKTTYTLPVDQLVRLHIPPKA